MKSLNKTQIAVISGALILFVLLLFANTKLLPKEEVVQPASAADANMIALNQMVQAAVTGLSKEDKQAIQKLDEAIKNKSDNKTALENMITKWDSLQNPSVAAYYMEQAALVSPSESNWKNAGDRYFSSSRFVDVNNRPILFGEAQICFEHVLALNPNNIEAKISLASCYVEGGSNPMKGIGMMREIEKTDSNNVNLQLNFAFFSEKSGQWQKAITRFEKVLRIQPDFIEAYIHLSDAYQQMGNKEKAIESLKKYISLEKDVTIKKEVQDYIDKLTMEETPGQKQ
ncbi:MAG: tetratricopeptide repeat protein [Bacteroidetes bacterium]|nr:tetratricopeptide repeat protein [Bacteroidota bacterium]